MELEVLLPFAAVILAGYLVQTVTGFGAMVVAMTFGALVLPIETIPPVAVPLSLVQNVWIAYRYRDGIDRQLLFMKILPLMFVGMTLGFLVSDLVAGEALRIAFGVLILALSGWELLRAVRGSDARPEPLGPAATRTTIFLAGVLHGIYATGGPLLVYAVGRLELGKHVFRATLTAVWLLLNIVLTGFFVFAGRVSVESLGQSALLLPTIPIGIVVGEWIHHRVDENRFRHMIFALLAAAALTLLLK